jgi:type IV secretory pathway VirB4 component
MVQPTSAPIRATTQEFLDIEDIIDDVILLRDGSAAIVIETTAVNFGLLSEEEQDALIYAYASLLNSLSFPIQICIMSKSMDISSYIEYIAQTEENQSNPIVKERIRHYKEFILSVVKENRVLEKKFYLIIPFFSLELGVKGAFSYGKKKALPFPKDYILSHAKTSLFPKRDHLYRQLGRIGLRGKQMPTQELAELFYNIYNPSITGEKLAETKGYSKPIVEGLGRS